MDREFLRRNYHDKEKISRTKIFRVRNKRMQFRCANCGTKRIITVPPRLRTKKVLCHKCKKTTKCILNKRISRRETQCGKLFLSTLGSKELEVNLVDISATGIGIDVPIDLARSGRLKVGNRVSFRCTWNRRLLGTGQYVIRNIKERRVGVEKIR